MTDAERERKLVLAFKSSWGYLLTQISTSGDVGLRQIALKEFEYMRPLAEYIEGKRLADDLPPEWAAR